MPRKVRSTSSVLNIMRIAPSLYSLHCFLPFLRRGSLLVISIFSGYNRVPALEQLFNKIFREGLKLALNFHCRASAESAVLLHIILTSAQDMSYSRKGFPFRFHYHSSLHIFLRHISDHIISLLSLPSYNFQGKFRMKLKFWFIP